MQPIIVRLWHGSLPLWVWWFLCIGVERGQTLNQFLEDWSSEADASLGEEDLITLEELLQSPPILTAGALPVLESVGWLTPEDIALINTYSLPRPLTQIDHRKLTPEMAAFFDLWEAKSGTPQITGQIIQSQRWGRSAVYRWRSHLLLPRDLQLDIVMDRTGEGEKIPVKARRTLTWKIRRETLWLGDLQVRLGSGLFSAGSFPPRIGLESLSTFQRWNFSLRSHRSSVTEGRVSGFGAISDTEFGRVLGTWSDQSGPALVQLAWIAPEVRGRWGSGIRFVNDQQTGWEGTVFGQIRGKKTGFTGEITRDRAGHGGAFLAASLRREGIRVLVSTRYYAPDFHPVNTNPPRVRNSLAQGEAGVFQGLRITRYPVKVDFYMDVSQPVELGEMISLNQGLRCWMQKNRWRWRFEIDWRKKPADEPPGFFPQITPLYVSRRREKMWLTRTLLPAWTIGLQGNETTVIVGNKTCRGWGFKGKSDLHTTRSSWTVVGMVVRVSDPLARMYFWRLNLPYEMGSRSWSGDGYGWEGRWMYRWETGARIGFRYGWIYQSGSGNPDPSSEGALIMELSL